MPVEKFAGFLENTKRKLADKKTMSKGNETITLKRRYHPGESPTYTLKKHLRHKRATGRDIIISFIFLFLVLFYAHKK
jgi:hypothetical protein